MSHAWHTPDDYGVQQITLFTRRTRRRWPSIVPLLLPLVLLVSGSRCSEPPVRCHEPAQPADFKVEQAHWNLYVDSGRVECS